VNLNQKLNNVDFSNCTVWQSHTTSYIIAFFGKESSEYRFITSYTFTSFSRDDDQEAQVMKSKPVFRDFINGCIENIENCGLKKREWKHVFITTRPEIFWGAILALLGFAFWLGHITADKSNQTPNQIPAYQNDSIHKK
jgi:hypothetical protein